MPIAMFKKRRSEKSQIRMAYLVSQYPRISESFILREVIALRELGFDIEVASINAPDREPKDLTEEEREESGRALYVKKSSICKILAAHSRTAASSPAQYGRALGFAFSLGGWEPKQILKSFFYFVEAVMIADWMRQNTLSHLHAHFATPASTVAMIAAQLGHATLSITVHGPDEFYDVSRYQLAKKIEVCQFLCTIGKFARSQLMKLSPVAQWGKFEVTPLGVSPLNFCARPPHNRNGCFEILCVGRLVPSKGQHVLIQAVDRLVKQGHDVKLRLVGDGPDRPSLQEMIHDLGLADRVSLEGAVNQDRIQKFYQQADVFVLPSFAEGIPVVLMEAMAIEVPCVTTRITGIPELIRDGIDGLLVTPSDDEELAAAITRMIHDPELCRQLGQAGRRRVLSRYDLRTNVGHLADVFRRRLPC